MSAQKSATVGEYIDSFADKATVDALRSVRTAILETAPGAVESIAYGIPTFKQGGKTLVHFGGFKTHIGFYATPTGHETFTDDLSRYKQGKGSVQFPLSEPMPLELIKRIVKFRLEEVTSKK